MTEFTPLPLENTSFSDFFRFYCFTTTEYYPGSCALKATFATGKKMTVKTLLFTAAAILGIQLLFTLIFHVIELGLNALGYTLAGSAAMETDYSVTLSLMLYAALIGPIAEELMYRGFVMRGLEKYGKIFAIVTSSVIFGLMHADFRQTILTFVIGLMFGYICIEYGIIWSCVLHIYNNYILGQLWSDLLATLPELWQNIVAYSLMTLILGLIAIVYFKNKDKVKKYLEDNKTPKRTYTRNWCSVWFILFAIVEVIRAINTINPLVK